MIDIHTHVLPGIDDGARSLDESVEMLRAAARSGTTDLVATPHANLEFRFDPQVVEERLAELQNVAGPAVHLHRGCDFHLYYENIQDALTNPSKYTINGKSYLLVEFSDLLIAPSTPQVFARLLRAGMIPIITHPERNYLLHARMDQIKAWVGLGCCVQVTAQSLLGRFGTEARDIGRQLIERGLVHFVASDAHDASDRTPRLDEAYRHVAARYGEACAESLFVVNPRAALSGEPLGDQPVPKVRTSRKWFKFWAQ